MTTRDTVERWVELFNSGDATAISALYAEDAVNHQIALSPVVGRQAIEEFHRETFAGGPLTCQPINLVVDGDWAALEWITLSPVPACRSCRARPAPRRRPGRG